jgi:hypothetical protein
MGVLILGSIIGFQGEMNDTRREKIKSILKEYGLKDLLNFIKDETIINVSYGFISDLMAFFNDLDWVNIEQFYFQSLIYEFNKIKGKQIKTSDYNSIIQLNKCMDEITLELDKYILNLQKAFKTDFQSSPMANFIDTLKDRLYLSSRQVEEIHKKETSPEKILF